VISSVARLVVLVALALAGWGVFRQYSARQVFENVSGIEGALGAVWWDPGRSNYHAEAGVLYRDDLEIMDLDRAVEHLERAVELQPYSSAQWVELARTYERLGRFEEAERAYLCSLELEQPSTDYRWELANFYMRVGRLDDAFFHLQKTVAEESDHMSSAVALLVHARFDLAQIERVWPGDTVSRMRLLELAIDWRANGRPGIGHDEVVALWNRLLASEPPPTVEAGDAFVAYVFEAGRHAEARAGWADVARRNGLVDPAYSAGANDVWDGGFEHPLSGATLDWRTWPDQGFELVRAPGEGRHGTAAVRIDFDGRHNVSLGNLQQLVMLEPGARYEIAFEAKTQSVTTEEGPGVWVLDPAHERILYRGDGVVGTTDWTRYSGSFLVPADCGSAVVRVVRLPSRRIAGQIEGTFWLDDVSLRRASVLERSSS